MRTEEPIERVEDLTDSSSNRIFNMSVEEARARVGSGAAAAVREIDGSFALVARDGEIVRLARSLDRPLRYFLAKREDGPMLVVSDRIDAIAAFLAARGLSAQFHPSYTRMVPAHHVVELHLIGCPDPDATHERFFTPPRGTLPADLDEIGRLYVGALLWEVSKWLDAIPAGEPIGVLFSGGIDSGAVFLVIHHALLSRGESPARLKAFTLSLGGGQDLEQARGFLRPLGLELFLEPLDPGRDALDPLEAVRVVEDYKSLDVESAASALAACREIRTRYPDWRHLADGDGGDENLKDYPIEENAELTIHSVLNNPLLYQEGWGVGKLKHSRTYTGGLSRACARSYAPLRRYGFEGFSPFMRPGMIEIAEGIPFAALTGSDVGCLYALKGEVVSRGIRQWTGKNMPVFPKRRFQHGALPPGEAARRFPLREAEYRAHFHSLYA